MRLAALFFLLTVPAWGQLTVSMPGPGPIQAVSSSNIVLVQSHVGTNGASGTYTVTMSSTGTGNFIQCVEGDYASNPTAPSVPTDGGDTFVTDNSTPNTGNGRLTYFSFPNSVSGRTTITMHPNSGASSAVCSEWSGVATASPFIGCGTSTSLIFNSTTQTAVGPPVQSTVNALAIGSVYNRVNATDTYSSLDNWTTLAASGDSGDGDQLYTQYIINGLPSWFTAGTSLNNARSQLGQTCVYKSAVAGSSTGNQPINYWRADDGGTNTTVITTANFLNAQHGMVYNDTAGAHGLTYSSTQTINPATPVVVNGKKYTTSAMSFAYDLGQNGANASTISLAPVSPSNASFSWGCFEYFPEVSDAVNPFTISGVIDGGSDRAEFVVTNDLWAIEAASGDSATGSLSGHLGQWIWVTGLYNGTGSGTHKMRVYTCASGCGTPGNWSQLGSEATQAVTGTNVATSLNWGRLGAESGGTGFTHYASGCQVDFVNATYPILP